MQLSSKRKTIMENRVGDSTEYRQRGVFQGRRVSLTEWKLVRRWAWLRAKSLSRKYKIPNVRAGWQLSLLNDISKLLAALLALDSAIMGEQPVSVLSAMPALVDESQRSKWREFLENKLWLVKMYDVRRIINATKVNYDHREQEVCGIFATNLA